VKLEDGSFDVGVWMSLRGEIILRRCANAVGDGGPNLLSGSGKECIVSAGMDIASSCCV
jgi:hypothetical protein